MHKFYSGGHRLKLLKRLHVLLLSEHLVLGRLEDKFAEDLKSRKTESTCCLYCLNLSAETCISCRTHSWICFRIWFLKWVKSLQSFLALTKSLLLFKGDLFGLDLVLYIEHSCTLLLRFSSKVICFVPFPSFAHMFINWTACVQLVLPPVFFNLCALFGFGCPVPCHPFHLPLAILSDVPETTWNFFTFM